MANIKLQRHHIVYSPEIIVGIRGDAHRVLNTIQRTIGTNEQIHWIKNLMLSLAYEVIRMEGEVQTGQDLRQPKFKKRRKTKKPAGEDY
jgi:hypothetical protein